MILMVTRFTGSEVVGFLRELHGFEERLAGVRGATLVRMREKIEEVRAKVPGPVLSHHDRVRARGRRSVAAVRNWVCCSCFLQVPVGNRAALVTGNDLAVCGHCGAFLYLDVAPEPEREQEAAAKPAKPAKRAKALVGKGVKAKRGGVKLARKTRVR